MRPDPRRRQLENTEMGALEYQCILHIDSIKSRAGNGRIALERQVWPLDPDGSKSHLASRALRGWWRCSLGSSKRWTSGSASTSGPEHGTTLEHIRSALDKDAGLDASDRVNTRENVRPNFELYKRITADAGERRNC